MSLTKKMMVPLVIIIFLMSLGKLRPKGEASPALQTTGSDWPMLMHDPAHSGYTSESLIPNPPTGELNLKWKVGLGERVEVQVQPVVAGDRVFVGVMNGKLHAIDAETGQIDWTYQAGGAIAATPAVAGGKVYFGCEDGKVYALDASNGNLVWSRATAGPVLSAPAVVDGVAYIGSFDGHLYALDADDGSVNWRYEVGGRVWTSPAVDVTSRRVYFGAEDMHAYCVDVDTGQAIWSRQLNGISMRNTYPVLSNDVVIFTTVKPGVEGYAPLEGYPFPDSRDPVLVWGEFYQQHPERRFLFFLDSVTGADKWNPSQKNQYTPLPIPYWGLLNPIVDPQGYTWLPASGGGGDHALDHDTRLWRMDLSTGVYDEVGSSDEFLMRFDETGRHTMGGDKYYYTIDADVALYDPATHTKQHLFGDSFSTHRFPLDPTPTIHFLRYAGAGIAMGGVPAASPLVIANGTGYFVSYSWLYALTPDHVASPGVVDLGVDHTHGPPVSAMTYQDAVDELNWRVGQIIAAGHLEPEAVLWGWAQPSLHGFWREGEVIRSLAETMPYLRPDVQASLRVYLQGEAVSHLFEGNYSYRSRCIVYGEEGIIDSCNPSDFSDEIHVYWFADDLNVIAENLFAMWAYVHYTGDWQPVQNNWGLITDLYSRLDTSFDPSLGFIVEREQNGSPKRWHTPQFNINLQIAAMLGVSRMAEYVGDAGIQNGANSRLQQLYTSRVTLGKYVQSLYDKGIFERAGPDEIIEGYEPLPYQGYRDRDTDTRQVYWMDGARTEIFSYPTSAGEGSGIITDGNGDYEDLIHYRPMFPELGEFMADHLLSETDQYVRTIANLNPWWYWCDATYTMQGGGENLYNQAHLSASIFQAKAYILGEDFATLKDQLPWEYTEAGFRDIYRLQNLVALLQAVPPTSKSVSSVTANSGDVLTYTISLLVTGATATITDAIPAGTAYVSNSAQIEPQVGTLTADSNLIHWTGVLTDGASLELTFAVTVTVTEPFAIINTAIVDNGEESRELTATTIANGLKSYLPIIMKGW